VPFVPSCDGIRVRLPRGFPPTHETRRTIVSRSVWSVAVFAVGLTILSPRPARAQDQRTGQMDLNAALVVTSAEAIVRRAPDRAFVGVTVETRARNPRDAQSENADAMRNVQRQLRSANLPTDAIRTMSYAVEPDYEFTNGRRVLRGYIARNAIELRVDDLGRLGELVDRATNAGATAVGDIRFDLKHRKAAELEALTDAVRDARARAEAMASAAGRAIQAIWRVEDERAATPIPRPMLGMARAAAAEAAPTPIVAGEIEIHARVTLTAMLK
jgi:uncharacterized protein YggE